MEIKKKVREGEMCPHCSKRQMNLQEHVKRMHGIRCDICGKTFAQKQQWVHHMRDRHQQNEKVATREAKVKEIDTWLKKERKSGKKGKKGQAKAPKADATGTPANDEWISGGMDADSDDGATGTPLEPPSCVDCGAKGPQAAAGLLRQGLSFRCVLVGRLCAAAKPEARVATAMPQNFATPTAGRLPGFGSESALAPSISTMPATATSGFGTPVAHSTAVMPIAAMPGFGVAPPLTPSMAAMPISAMLGFGTAPPVAPSIATMPMPTAPGFAHALAVAADIPVGDDDDDL